MFAQFFPNKKVNKMFFYRELKPEERQCSLYMKELQRFILRVSNDYFKQFPRCDVIQKRWAI